MDGMLSQEEINALLSGMDIGDSSDGNAGDDTAVQVEDQNTLSDMQKDTLGEISNISMGTAATTLSSLLSQKVNISTPVVSYAKWDDLVTQYDKPCVFLQISYKEGLMGNNVLVLRENDVKIITDLMMGGDGTNTDGEITDLHLSAIGEAMNQMMGSAATSISSMLDMKIDIMPPVASLVDLNDGVEHNEFNDFTEGIFVKISFSMVIGELVDSQIMQLYPIEFAKSLCEKFMAGDSSDDGALDISMPDEAEINQISSGAPAPAPQPMDMNMGMGMAQQPMDMNMGMGMGQQMPGMQMQGMPMQQMGMQMQGMPMQQMPGMPMQGMPMDMNMGMNPQMQGMPYGMPMGMQMQNVNVQPAQFQQFTGTGPQFSQRENIGLIMDVPLEVTAELGRTSKSIQEILDFAPGTIIELDKIAGEPIDVLVNGKFVAKGEVVVIEESFGIRITDIIQEQ